jgi:Uma2 family endonuclease
MAETAKSSVADDGRICDVAGKREATIDDLYHVEGKAELVNGELVLMAAAGKRHGRVALRIAASLLDVALPHRRSFSPDVALSLQPDSDGFVDGAPVFAVEVRSPEDDGPAAERAMADKRADYFAAGTLVVWDVDIVRDKVGRVYRASDPSLPTTFHGGEQAEAEPAAPDWSMPVDELFPDQS